MAEGRVHGATPKLIDLHVVTTIGAEAKKYGLDDFLTTVGPWRSLLDRMRDALPDAPPSDDSDRFRAGDWRMNEETYTTEVLRISKSDGSTTKSWEETGVAIIGRIARTLAVRSVSDEEIQSGTLAEDSATQSGTTIEIAVKWRQYGVTETAIITGPDTMLADPTNWWATRSGGHVPTALLLHPDWPAGPQWVAGVKGHRSDETVVTDQWEHMGWVPVANSSPVFIIGKQVINRNGDGCKAATPGVTEHALAMATKFGVQTPSSDEQLKEAMLKVWRTYRGGVWTDKRVAALVLAAALRPVVPLPCRNAILISGARRMGKSWTAGAMMAFWQRNVGTWSNNKLPGSAEDTMAATEGALARAAF